MNLRTPREAAGLFDFTKGVDVERTSPDPAGIIRARDEDIMKMLQIECARLQAEDACGVMDEERQWAKENILVDIITAIRESHASGATPDADRGDVNVTALEALNEMNAAGPSDPTRYPESRWSELTAIIRTDLERLAKQDLSDLFKNEHLGYPRPDDTGAL